MVAGTPVIEFQVADPANRDEILAKPGAITTDQLGFFYRYVEVRHFGRAVESLMFLMRPRPLESV